MKGQHGPEAPSREIMTHKDLFNLEKGKKDKKTGTLNSLFFSVGFCRAEIVF